MNVDIYIVSFDFLYTKKKKFTIATEIICEHEQKKLKNSSSSKSSVYAIYVINSNWDIVYFVFHLCAIYVNIA